MFKVETIGDSYMAVTGLPEPQINHAERVRVYATGKFLFLFYQLCFLILSFFFHKQMCRFAFDCLNKVNEVTNDLESILGPGTSALSMRFGLNSGPVTAGVLRGDR